MRESKGETAENAWAAMCQKRILQTSEGLRHWLSCIGVLGSLRRLRDSPSCENWCALIKIHRIDGAVAVLECMVTLHAEYWSIYIIYIYILTYIILLND